MMKNPIIRSDIVEKTRKTNPVGDRILQTHRLIGSATRNSLLFSLKTLFSARKAIHDAGYIIREAGNTFG
jgi:hypothetical protein